MSGFEHCSHSNPDVTSGGIVCDASADVSLPKSLPANELSSKMVQVSGSGGYFILHEQRFMRVLLQHLPSNSHTVD